MIFDRGKEFVVGEICSNCATARRVFKFCLEMLASCLAIPVEKYDEKSFYELILQHGYQLDSRFTNSVVFILVKDGDSCYHGNLFAKMSLRNSITCYACDCILFVPGMIELGYVHIFESSADCFCSSMDFSQRVFDPGKEIDVLRSGNCVYELILGVRYCFEVLFEYLYVFLFGINGDSGNASMLVGKMMQLECAPRDKLILQSTRNNKSGNEWSLRGQESLEKVVGIKNMLVKTNGSGLKWFLMLILGSPSLIICGSSARSSNKVESYKWGWGILNRVVKAEAMSVGGALLCT
ncbi:uncharacterized protein LOC113356342 [Papaver somniferum]|uniref:uncharacterized protein LOC113356342 n=1 Tax=Papaver somniferum TaxID=3469 RepID=UPI000E70330F|nr:uncharacterized protein LOC113356342 [Papaver somniferum]